MGMSDYRTLEILVISGIARLPRWGLTILYVCTPLVSLFLGTCGTIALSMVHNNLSMYMQLVQQYEVPTIAVLHCL